MMCEAEVNQNPATVITRRLPVHCTVIGWCLFPLFHAIVAHDTGDA